MTERFTFFAATYELGSRPAAGGGVDGEDIEILEMSLDEAPARIDTGEIMDGKTIMLLQYAKLHQLID